jgi:hypothetical protein
MHDPAEHALVVKALVEGLSNCVAWDEKSANNVRDNPANLGIPPRAIRGMVIAHVRTFGAGVVVQRVEDRPGWRDLYRFYYMVIVPCDGMRHGLFVEMRLTDEDPDVPEVTLVNAHPELRF